MSSYGRKRIIYLGILFEFLAIILYLWPATVASAIIGRVLSGMAFSMVVLVTIAKVEDKLKKNERGEKAGIFMSISFFGLMIGSFLGPFLADMFFLRFPFLISGIGMALMLVWLFVWKSHHKPVVKKHFFNPLIPIRKFIAEKKLRAMAFIGMAMHTRVSVTTIFLPLLILSFGAGYKEVGILFFFHMISHVFQGFAGKLVDKKGSRNIVVISVIMSSLFIILAGFTKSYVLLVIVMFFEGLANSFWNISAWTFMSEIGVRKKMEGVVVCSYSSLANIGRFVFALVSGFLAVALGISSLFIIVGVISLVTVLAFSPMLASKFRVAKKDEK